MNKSDLFEITEQLLNLGIVVMLSPYNCHNSIDIDLAKMVVPCDNRHIRFSFSKIKNIVDKYLIYHCADEEFAYAEYKSAEEFIAYVKEYFLMGSDGEKQ